MSAVCVVCDQRVAQVVADDGDAVLVTVDDGTPTCGAEDRHWVAVG